MNDENWELDPEDPVSARRSELPSTQRRLTRIQLPSFRRELWKALAVLAGGAVLAGVVWIGLNAVLDRTGDGDETTTTLDVVAQWRDRYGADVEEYHDEMTTALSRGCRAELPQDLDWIEARAAAAPEPFDEWAFHVLIAHETAIQALDVCGRNPADGAEGIEEASVSLQRALDAYPTP